MAAARDRFAAALDYGLSISRHPPPLLLEGVFPFFRLAALAKWMGHSPKIAGQHYLIAQGPMAAGEEGREVRDLFGWGSV